MSIKTLNQLPLKTAFESTDNIVLLGANGGARISKANAENWIKGMNYKSTRFASGVPAGSWIRIASFATIASTCSALIIVAHEYATRACNPLVISIGGSITGKAINLTPLSPSVYTKYGSNSTLPSFPSVRIVNDGGVYYLEVKVYSSEKAFHVTALQATDRLTLLEPSLSTATEVYLEFDLTASATTLQAQEQIKSSNMQTIDNQANVIGGGGIEFSLYPYLVTVRQKGGRHEREDIARQAEKPSDYDDHRQLSPFSDSYGGNAETNEGCNQRTHNGGESDNNGFRRIEDTGDICSVGYRSQSSFIWKRSERFLGSSSKRELHVPQIYLGCRDSGKAVKLRSDKLERLEGILIENRKEVVC